MICLLPVFPIRWIVVALLGSILASAVGVVACADLGEDESAAAVEASATATSSEALIAGPRPKYVFLFIGDGMASVQIHAAEAYLANKVETDDVGGSDKAQRLSMSTLPVQGMQMTFPWNSLITDSAPAATALATGKKTGDGVIAMDPTKTKDLRTIAEVAKADGRAVGIVSSVSIDHATPAAFYAHEPSRNNYHYIGHDLVASGFDYFGGGGFLDPDGTRSGVTPKGNVLEAATAAGYTLADTRQEFESLVPGVKALAINPVLDSSKALYYEIDRVTAGDDAAHISLAEFTRKGIDLLTGRSNKKGVFMMVEGGKIDWACHANDARTSIDDVVAFDDAVGVAIEFMNKHPWETLVVVTGDHETGGLSIGWSGTGYASNFEKLEAQKISFLEFDRLIKKVKDAGSVPGSIVDTTLDEDMLALLGLDYTTLSAFEKERLDNAYTKTMFSTSSNTNEEDGLLYGSYNPISVTVTHILNNRAGIGWTTFSHTAVPVPVLAGGVGAQLFGGYYDNTDVALKLAVAMRLRLGN
jgi:alkaline phosphatase